MYAQSTLEQHGLELHRAVYMQIFFHANGDWNCSLLGWETRIWGEATFQMFRFFRADCGTLVCADLGISWDPGTDLSCVCEAWLSPLEPWPSGNCDSFWPKVGAVSSSMYSCSSWSICYAIPQYTLHQPCPCFYFGCAFIISLPATHLVLSHSILSSKNIFILYSPLALGQLNYDLNNG